MSNPLSQAQDAARQGNWSQLSQLLQKLLLTEAETALTEEDVEQVVMLALLVLDAGDFQERWDVMKVFPALGDGMIAPLIDLLQDDEADHETRWFAARILGGFDSPVTIHALVKCLQNSDDEDLAAMVAEALAALGKSAIADLTDLLANDGTRVLAVQSLAQIRRSETISPLLGVVNDPQPEVRMMAIDALGSFHDPRVPPVLLQALSDPAASVRKAAVAALGVRADLATELDLVSHLTDRLWDLNLEVCQQAAISLGRMGTDAATEALFRVLKSPHTPLSLQIETVRALGWVGNAIALDHLHQALLLLNQAESSAVIEEIVTILGRWQEPELQPKAAQILIDWLRTDNPAKSNPAIKRAISLGLGYLAQPQALESLTELLTDADLGVRLHAISGLKTLDFHASRQHLENLLQQPDLPDALRQGVAIALQEWNC